MALRASLILSKWKESVNMAKRNLPNKNVRNDSRPVREDVVPEVKVESVEQKSVMVTVVNCSALSVRSGPEKKDNLLFVVPVGEKFSLLREMAEWSMVESPIRGKSGWVMNFYIEKDK